MSTAAVIGCTGLVGSHILATLLAPASASSTPSFPAVHTVSRRAPPTPPGADSSRLHAVVDADTSTWAGAIAAAAPGVVFSALGTTRAAAGGLDAQWKIDHDLNVELARAARAAGAHTFVFVSSAGTGGLGGHFPYSRMKRGVEQAVRDAGFEHAVVLRPGALMGEREEQRAAEGAFKAVIDGASRLFGAGFRDFWGQDADVVARAAVRAAEMAGRGEAPGKFWCLYQ
jgi:uncharacterized protein YbjT (DUF2867 family)